MKKILIIVLFLLKLTSNALSQNIKSMEFHNQEISDILLALAEASGTSIITDETVKGKAFCTCWLPLPVGLPVNIAGPACQV